MASGGTNIKSAEEHKKNGTFKRSRHADRLSDSPLITPVENIPEPPEHFDARHRAVWNKVCSDIHKMGNLVAPDIYLIEIFVSHWILWQDAIADVRQNGYSILVPAATGTKTMVNPSVTIMNDSAKMCNTIAGQFGFSAKSRMGIKVAAPVKKGFSILDTIKGGTLVKTKTG